MEKIEEIVSEVSSKSYYCGEGGGVGDDGQEEAVKKLKALLTSEVERTKEEIWENIMKLPTVPQYTEIGEDGTVPPSQPSEWIFMRRKDLVKALSDIGGKGK